MPVDARMLEIIRKLGDATPPPIRLSKVFQSPAQGFFAFSVSAEDRAVAAEVLDALARASVNIRFLNEHRGRCGETRMQLCVDAESLSRTGAALQSRKAAGRLNEVIQQPHAVILSLYPFSGQPQVAERVFYALAQHGVPILAANTATSVFSLVVAGDVLEPAMVALRRVFLMQ
jgi:aspartokinase